MTFNDDQPRDELGRWIDGILGKKPSHPEKISRPPVQSRLPSGYYSDLANVPGQRYVSSIKSLDILKMKGKDAFLANHNQHTSKPWILVKKSVIQ